MNKHDYSPITCFFGDFNQILDALTDGDYRSVSNAEFLFANINKVIAKFDERIGKIVGFSESEIHFLNGKTRIGTSIKSQEEFNLLTRDKRFLPSNRTKGYCLKKTVNKSKRY